MIGPNESPDDAIAGEHVSRPLLEGVEEKAPALIKRPLPGPVLTKCSFKICVEANERSVYSENYIWSESTLSCHTDKLITMKAGVMRIKKNKRLVRDRIKKLERLGSFCYICGCKMQAHNPKKDNGFTMDHVIAKVKMGTTKKPACKKCNERKAAMDIIKVPKGTKIKINGLPFELISDTNVFGEEENFILSQENVPQTKDMCSEVQAHTNP